MKKKKRQISREKSGKLDETDEKNTIQLNWCYSFFFSTILLLVYKMLKSHT